MGQKQSTEKLPSPADGSVRLKDSDAGYKYIEFPEDTIFLESTAINADFRKGVAYVPVQRKVGGSGGTKRLESHLYEITTSSTTAKHVAGPITSPDGSTEVTVFGSHLTSKGILYLCAFNRNSILALDLNKLPSSDTVDKTVACYLEIDGLASPNDVCVDPKNEQILYVAGGTFRYLCCCLPFSNSAYGKVTQVTLGKNNTFRIKDYAKGFNTLAGIEVVGENVWVAQLFDVVKVNKSNGQTREVWKGNNGEGQVWLADNIDIFGQDTILCPAYSMVEESFVKRVLNRSFVSSSLLFTAQMITAFMRGERLRQALYDPEVSLSFSNTYIQEGKDPAPIMIFLMTSDASKARHFYVDLEQTRKEHPPREIKDDKGKVLGKRHFFNEQVTHAAHLVGEDGTGFIACVNFEQPRILLLNDTIFRNEMSTNAVVE